MWSLYNDLRWKTSLMRFKGKAHTLDHQVTIYYNQLVDDYSCSNLSLLSSQPFLTEANIFKTANPLQKNSLMFGIFCQTRRGRKFFLFVTGFDGDSLIAPSCSKRVVFFDTTSVVGSFVCSFEKRAFIITAQSLSFCLILCGTKQIRRFQKSFKPEQRIASFTNVVEWNELSIVSASFSTETREVAGVRFL